MPEKPIKFDLPFAKIKNKACSLKKLKGYVTNNVLNLTAPNIKIKKDAALFQMKTFKIIKP